MLLLPKFIGKLYDSEADYNYYQSISAHHVGKSCYFAHFFSFRKIDQF